MTVYKLYNIVLILTKKFISYLKYRGEFLGQNLQTLYKSFDSETFISVPCINVSTVRLIKKIVFRKNSRRIRISYIFIILLFNNSSVIFRAWHYKFICI